MTARYLIIGDGAAGTSAAETLRRGDPRASITLVSDDPHPSYFRAALTNYLLGELREHQIWAVPPTFYGEQRIARLHGRVASIDPSRSQVCLVGGGAPLPYDALLIASGARARPPTFEGADLPGIATLRTLQDVRFVMDLISLYRLERAAVIGGGPLALEWALAMRERGVAITLLVREARFLGSALDAVASDLLLARIRRSGVDVRVSDEVQRALPGPGGRVAGVVTRQGQHIPCGLVAAAIGVVCNTDFLAGSGVTLGARGGVVVDDRLQSSAPRIFAAGDVAELAGRLSQKWEPARVQGQIAALNMAGGDHRYAPGVEYFATRLYDLDFASVGAIGGAEAGADGDRRSGPAAPIEELCEKPRNTGRIAYRKLLLQGGKLVGALMLGEREERVRQRGTLYKRLIDEAVDVSAVKAELLDPTFDLRGWLKTRIGIEKPRSPPAQAVPSPGAMLGTSAIDLSKIMSGHRPGAAAPPAPLAAPGAAGGSPPAAGPVGQDASRAVMLSIGLRMPEVMLAAARGEGAAVFLEGRGRRWEIAAHAASIGRAPDGQVVLDDPGVSNVHAQITRHGANHFLRDLGSRNGTWVNGAQIVLPHLLRDGDRIHLGATDLVFRGPPGDQQVSHGIQSAPPGIHSAPPGIHSAPPDIRSAPPDIRSAPPGTPSMAPVPVSMAGTPPGMPSSGPVTPGAPGRLAHLVVRSGASVGLRFALTGKSITLGRDPASQVRIDSLSVWRRHALFSEFEGRWHVSDLHSSRGTFRNGARLAPGNDVPLEEGDELALGETVLVFTGA